jgi:acetolactate synthase-1/3 small subunit
MLKIKFDPGQRTEIVQICDIFRAKIIDVAPQSVNVEMTGNPNKIKAFLNLVAPYEIIEMARTGAVALKRG